MRKAAKEEERERKEKWKRGEERCEVGEGKEMVRGHTRDTCMCVCVRESNGQKRNGEKENEREKRKK